MRQAIEKKKKEIENYIASLEQNKKKTEKFLGRFSINKGQNFLEYMLKSKIEGIDLNIRFKKLDVEKFVKALEIMKDLSFRADPADPEKNNILFEPNNSSMVQFFTRSV